MTKYPFAILFFLLTLTACGGGGRNVGEGSGNGGETPPVSPQLVLLAGDVGGEGNLDGIGPIARFSSPQGVAVDIQGNIFVADTGNHVIRKITPSGVVSTFAGSAGMLGSADGLGDIARFNGPSGVAVGPDGMVYVADNGNATIRKISPSGIVTTFAGTAGVTGSADGLGDAARFSSTRAVAVDTEGNLYVADSNNFTVRKITPAGVVSTLAGLAHQSGNVDGIGAAARFYNPSGVAVGVGGKVFVADSCAWGDYFGIPYIEGNCTIRQITPTGEVSTLAGSAGAVGSMDGTGANARFLFPRGVAAGANGDVYVVDTGNHAVRGISANGVVSTLAGSPGDPAGVDGSGTDARFNGPVGAALDAGGNVYIADTGNHMIRKITPAGNVSTLAGVAGEQGAVDGAGVSQFYFPRGVAVDTNSNVYLADELSRIYKITPGGEVIKLAGVAGVFGWQDGDAMSAIFKNPINVAVDSIGSIYVADSGNSVIRKISPMGTVSTLAGMVNQPGSDDGVAGAARFHFPVGVALDAQGNVYVADSGNHTIRKITPQGMVSTLVGQAGISGAGDGVGSAARFNQPFGLVVDVGGNIYVSDKGNHIIRRITSAGVVSTLAGLAGVPGIANGAGSDARFNVPSGVAVDVDGNVYVADTENFAVRKITPNGVVSTYVGVPGSHGIQLGELPGSLSKPVGLAMSAKGLVISSGNAVLLVETTP